MKKTMNSILTASLILTTFLSLQAAPSEDGSTLLTGLTDLSDGSKIEQYIRSNLGKIRSTMIHGNPSYNIPPLDPYKQDENLPKKFRFSTSLAKGVLEVENVVVTGLSKFKLNSLEVNTQKKSIQFELEVPVVKMAGRYKVDGTINLDGNVAMTGQGPFTAELDRPVLKIYLGVQYENGTGWSVSGTSVDMDFDDLDFDLEGFMPGSPLANWVKIVIKNKVKEHFEQYKEKIESKVSEFMEKTINSLFDAINDATEEEDEEEPDHNVQKRQIPCKSSTANMNKYIDTVLSNARGTIISKADPLRLKDFKKVVRFYDGKVTGLSSIKRTGNVQLSCTSSTISLSVNLGFSRITAGYRWKKKIVFFTKRGRVSVSVRSPTVRARISQRLQSGAKPVLNDFDLKIRGVRVRIHGLSIFGHVLAALVSIVGSIFRKAVANAAEKPIKKAIQKALNKVKIPL
ncbi:Uncharacterised protein g9146 [Pycnogonum litorale]